jgi:hypothetical protein
VFIWDLDFGQFLFVRFFWLLLLEGGVSLGATRQLEVLAFGGLLPLIAFRL